MKKRKMRMISLLLAAVLAGANHTVVLAEAVSENAIKKETEASSVSTNTAAAEEDIPLVSENAIRSGEGTPGNPYYVASEETKWNYVYFGSYPQTEVTGKELTAKIINAPYDENGDAWVDGVKYRRVYRECEWLKSDVNFGDKLYRFYKWERIKWRVLQNDGNTLFLLSDKAIDCDWIHNVQEAEWEVNCIRGWLYSDFYVDAFSKEEQKDILEKTIINEDNPSDKTEGGRDTKDKVFLLSYSEADNKAYGFCDDNLYSTSIPCREVKATDYAKAKGIWFSTESGKEDNCWWMLRTPGRQRNDLCVVTEDGNLLSGCHAASVLDAINYPVGGIVPAIYLPVSSLRWDTVDDKTSGDGGQTRVLASLQASKTKTVYMAGEHLNTDDLKVIAGYRIHGKQQLLEGAYTTNAAEIDMKTPGNKTLVITHSAGGVTKTAAVPIQVKGIKVSQLSITGPSKKLAAGKKIKLTLKTLPENATNKSVEWKSSNQKYATVDGNGKITLKKAGAGKSVTITASAKDGSNVKASYQIKIMKHAVKSIKLKAPAKKLKAGKSMNVKATIKTTGKQVNKTLKWSSSNTKYATVNSKGKVKAKKAGKGKTVTITAAATDGSGKKGSVKIKIK